MSGYFAIGIENVKRETNIGTLFRSAMILGADYIFTIGNRYKRQSSDTTKSWRNMPLFNYRDFDDFYIHMPYNCRLVGVELHPKAYQIKNFVHPDRCIYLLGAEDHGLTNKALEKCHSLLQIPGDISLNVSMAGSIIMYDRLTKAKISAKNGDFLGKYIYDIINLRKSKELYLYEKQKDYHYGTIKIS